MSELPRSFGPYSLLKLLAKGGMGEIYLARTGGISHFEKYYAVKKLLKKFAHDNDVCGRFIDEAKLGARLQHPNIVQVYDLGKVTDELYMATEFVDGFDLRRVLRFCHEKKKRIPLDIALFIVREVLSGLAYAHRQVDAEGQSINLIHRDISPQNVLVSFEGEVKIIDFGLAKSTQRSQETQANVLLGNFGYMSPEQARGQKLDVRTDVYSTGIVLFELVTGTKRFVDENPLRLLEMVARPTPIMPSDRAPGVPKAIDRIFSGATVVQREGRYAGAEVFRDEVTQALHKLNPRATREHLAQFLNHLFLGGQAPPAVDSDALNKSVAIQVKDLHEKSNAFTTTKEDDVQDRGLTGFSDDAVQTGSHPLMRAARVGDTLSHGELTGDEGETSSAGSPALAKPPAIVPPAMPKQAAMRAPVPQVSADDISQPHVAVMPAPPLPPASLSSAQPRAPSPPAAAFAAPPPTPPPVPIFGQPLTAPPIAMKERPTDPALRPPRSEPESLDDQLAGEPLDGDPLSTEVYDAPTFANAVMPEPPQADDGIPDADDLELLDLELTPLGGDYETMPMPPAPQPAMPPPPLPPPAPTPAPRATVTSVVRGAVVSSVQDKKGSAIVSTLKPSRDHVQEQEREEPTMVVDLASLPGAEVAEVPSAEFNEGPGADSLIIDFEVDEADGPTQRVPVAPAPGRAAPANVRPPAQVSPVIRPAAQPRGRVVTGNVAKPKRPEPPPPSNKRR